MRLAVAASPQVAIPSLNALLKSEHSLVSVISQPDRPAGRGKVLTPTPVSQWAIDNQVPLLRPESFDQISDLLVDLDCVITIGYGVLLSEKFLDLPRYGFLNLHFSLLPRWRGAAPVQRAIEAGDPVTGVTVFKLDSGMDTGPIYRMDRFALDPDITSDELFIELAELGVESILETLIAIERGERPTPQPSAGATRAYKLSREDGRIDWQNTAEVISAKIRAYSSQPGAWTNFRGQPIKLAKPTISDLTLQVGEISVVNREVFIGTSTQALKIGQITAVGKQSLTASEWANGARVTPGEICE